MNLEDYIKNLPPELQEKARSCKSTEELLSLAGDEAVKLPDEALEAIAGGKGSPQNCSNPSCPNCGSSNVELEREAGEGRPWVRRYFKCNDCGHEWNKKYWDP